jgi:hypothetical protein
MLSKIQVKILSLPEYENIFEGLRGHHCNPHPKLNMFCVGVLLKIEDSEGGHHVWVTVIICDTVLHAVLYL